MSLRSVREKRYFGRYVARYIPLSAPVAMLTTEIAERTGKRHDHVMRDARRMLVELHGEGSLPRFGERYRNDQNGQGYPCYRLLKRKVMILVTGHRSRAVLMLLGDEEWAQWSDREIARQCAVHHELVGRLRAAHLAFPPDAPRTVERGGTVYPMNPRRARPVEPEPEPEPSQEPEAPEPEPRAPADVIPFQDRRERDRAALAEAGPMRCDLSPADRARVTIRRKTIYEELHPEARLGSNQHERVRQIGEPSAPRFTAATSRATGRSERKVQRDAERGAAIDAPVLELVAGTDLDRGGYLDALKKVPKEKQAEHIAEWARITEGKRKGHSAQLAQNETKRADGKGHRQEGGVSAAARDLGLPRDAVSRALKIAG